MRQRSFTLIELMVVIAIVGLLASVVLVSMGGVKGKAKTAQGLQFSQSLYHVLGSEAVGVWNFDEGPDGSPMTTAKDASGYDNNGTCSGASCPTYTVETPQKVVGSSSGKFALSFDGANDYVDVGNNANLRPETFTVELWVKDITGGTGLVSYYGGNNGWLMRAYYIKLCNGASCAQFNFGSVDATKWSHLAFTYDSGSDAVRLYRNGTMDLSSTFANYVVSAAGENLHIGKDNWWSGDYSAGLIDDVRIYNQAVSSGEIQKHYADGLEKHQDLAIR